MSSYDGVKRILERVLSEKIWGASFREEEERKEEDKRQSCMARKCDSINNCGNWEDEPEGCKFDEIRPVELKGEADETDMVMERNDRRKIKSEMKK